MAVVDEVIRGVLAAPVDGKGTRTNTAPLTHAPHTATATALHVRQYADTPCIQVPITMCTLLDPLASNPDETPTVGVSADRTCDVTFTPDVLFSREFFALQIVTDASGVYTTALPLRVWAPDLPLRLYSDATVLRPIALSTSGTLLLAADTCAPRYLSTEVRVWGRFTLGAARATNLVDVSALARTRLRSTDPNVATVDPNTGTVTAHTPGATTLVLAGGGAEPWTIAVVVAPPVLLEVLAADVFADIAVGYANGTASAQLQTATITREGTAGAQHVAVTMVLRDPVSGAMYVRPVNAAGEGVAVQAINRTVATVVNATHVHAIGTGYTVVYATLNNTATCGAPGTRLSLSSPVDVVLPAAVGAHVVDMGGDVVTHVVVAHASDPAYLAGVAAEQALGIVLQYPVYTRDATRDERTLVSIVSVDAESAPFTVAPCYGTHLCVQPREGRHGSAAVVVSFAHESVTATVNVTVVQAIALTLAAYAHPACNMVEQYTLAAIADTGVFQKVQMQGKHRAWVVRFAVDSQCTISLFSSSFFLWCQREIRHPRGDCLSPSMIQPVTEMAHFRS